MTTHRILGFGAVVVAGLCTHARGDCPLDHYFFGQEDGKLVVDKRLIYRHGDLQEGYYPLSWSAVYGCWTVGEPGFSDTSDPAYGFDPSFALEGTPNVAYQIWFEVLDLAPNFKIRLDDGTWITQVGQQYNLSNWNEHHVHMKYRAYVPHDPPPDYPFYVTYRLVDQLGPYGQSEPFICVFNRPAPAVEQTEPAYEGLLPVQAARLRFVFHRAVVVVGGSPVAITDEQQNDYTQWFGFEISGDGLAMTLHQSGGTLPAQRWLRIALTQNLRDAAEPDRPVIPFTQQVYTRLRGDLNCDGALDGFDIQPFVLALTDPASYAAEYADCATELADCNADGQVDGFDIQPFVELLTGS